MRKGRIYLYSMVLLFGAFNAAIIFGASMELSSSTFRDGSSIPAKYAMPAAGGSNTSIQLSWKNTPAGTKSFALAIIDPHPVAGNWVHWLVINIPPESTSLDEGASGRKMPAGAVELRNSFGNVGYGGPQPPKGSGVHPYVVTIYALSVAHLDLKLNTDLAGFNESLEGKVLGKASITGHYGL